MSSNRPFLRSLIKIATRLALGRSRAHVQDWFPGLKLQRASETQDGSIWYQGELVGNLLSTSRTLRFAPRSVLIIGSGPSIEQNDLTRIDGSSCILLNGALTLVPSVIAQPLAVAIEDERFVWRHFDLIQRIPVDSLCLASVSTIRAICELDRTWFKDRAIALIDNVRKPYAKKRRSVPELRALSYVRLSEDGATGFSENPTSGVFQAGSVVISAMQFAIRWKPREIGLLGIDLGNADMSRFYETTEKAYSGIRKAQPRIIDHLNMARNVAAENGIEIANHSSVSPLVDCGFGYDEKFSRPG
ncbi:glycosyl transferase [Ensifer sp. T173]|uniref:Glycosyl transferase n=1 Tax=Ensifer canadensis TaxID=555315 RepID=A0AAW4FSH0_9HYPH|nr:glycosyl transferase [Ensifer canadensis]MBM3094314.1 glycosyl transferase [Ensifer canadensis]UBI80535.1 glycosyl transferase [Ensifer canadensis]